MRQAEALGDSRLRRYRQQKTRTEMGSVVEKGVQIEEEEEEEEAEKKSQRKRLRRFWAVKKERKLTMFFSVWWGKKGKLQAKSVSYSQVRYVTAWHNTLYDDIRPKMLTKTEKQQQNNNKRMAAAASTTTTTTAPTTRTTR